MTDNNCADCDGFDIEWMYYCEKHKGIKYCRGCECPFCAEDGMYDSDHDLDNWFNDEQSS